jgi:hypothetical protein
LAEKRERLSDSSMGRMGIQVGSSIPLGRGFGGLFVPHYNLFKTLNRLLI